MSLYYAVYRETEETTEEWHDWLVHCGRGNGSPLDLASITDVCASARVEASLRDEAGWPRGTVDRDGNYVSL